ncbi:MAG: hypothetical protein A3I77_03265 [Gammaproteobacteria bacterium RIFCSPLOWO2_02_FULL_42_14]|nr:MAG: hypothetical protein A3B71_01245 [Gammaproteobacteria bacterium RIFCSPHIGHO2_02_FULL_42_43]OGT28039.1 MAG: hypothetical protein A2624_02445 [Gammaproteobacteria bacterium RIFCSPHIGHO2_01_FULL_42_8]OGT51692.1 MAG: hypothetical protein A3E54_03460 [Gammaproteobacteria bacterium RIFCSPHIGHO2_12_FULL_41_25]OGT61589.1 MAG: hypothetical protein A3I77_03265 [Gammaproteobacteria bacterium RIFCSPLOWO2_02_FULL_42_14]OGT86213.1 MAG: hypothetical protein A3G86_06115 [Gammaproteobacteria bacterium R
MRKKLLITILVYLLCLVSTFARSHIAPLSPDQAFQFSATAKDYQTILLQWKIAPHYYLYQKDFRFHVIKPEKTKLGDPIYPADTMTLNTSLGNFIVYKNNLVIPVPIIDAAHNNITVQVHYQGCSQSGYCYPPISKIVVMNLNGNYGQPVFGLSIDVAPENISASAPSHSFFFTLMSFFGFGILLSFTPCILPMIPILSSIIIGRRQLTRPQAFLLSLFYVLGMAITYAVAGIVFGFVGSNLSAVFQNTWVIISFSAIFVVMALSLFGLFELQLPAKLQSLISNQSHHQKNGTYFGVFVMGILSTLIVSPCVTPPLVVALGWITQQGDIALGGAALFVLGLGMGVPLLLIGAIGAHWLPKAGRWMNVIKYTVGVLLLAVAFSLLLRAFHFSSTSQLNFQSVQSVEMVETALQQAHKKPVMLDFYADWCIACKELETFTFSDPAVKSALSHYVLLRADVTKNTPKDQLLEQHFGVIAPPTILFFKNQAEIQNSRLIGYTNKKRFLQHLTQIGQ